MTVDTLAIWCTGAILGITGIVTVLALVSTRELAGSGSHGFTRRIARFANFSIVPLMVTFMVLVIVTITELL